MKKILFGILLSLALVIGAFAQEKQLPDAPIPKIQDKGPAHTDPYAIKYAGPRVSDKHFWFMVSGMGASSLAPLAGIHHCAQGDVETCFEHYGGRYQGWAFTEVIGVSAAIGIYHMCRKEYNNSPKCDIIPSIVMGSNVAFGVQQWTQYHPENNGH